MIINNLEQGSQEWHNFRAQRIGASIIGGILGYSPYSTRGEIWEHYVGIQPLQVNEYAVARGKELEPIARPKVESQFGCDFPPMIAVCDDDPLFMASLDGLNLEKRLIWEHKCPGKEEHGKTIFGPPEKYYWQCQQQLMCLEGKADAVVFTTLHEEKEHYDFQYCLVYPNKDAWAEIKHYGHEFWEYVKRKERPPLTKRDWMKETDPEWLSIAEQYCQIENQKKTLEIKLATLKEELETKAKHNKVVGGGLKFQFIERKGAVQYQKIPQLKNIDLDQYRGAPSTYWQAKVLEKEIG